MTLTAAMETPLESLSDRDIDAARVRIGQTKLMIRCSAPDWPALLIAAETRPVGTHAPALRRFHALVAVLKPYNDRIAWLNMEYERRLDRAKQDRQRRRVAQ